MTPYRLTVGLEVHAELATATKMFCNSKNDPDETRPNVNICPVCMAHPGTLPVPNKEAVKHVLKVGLALGGTIADYTEFDRKNYFYPDIPKGYQLSQYKYPLVSGGELAGIAVTRVHLEEDTARSQHDGEGSIVDFNRAGVPLMELVTEPVIKSAEEAGKFARELQLLFRTLGVSEANMEKGEMRVEANISVSKTDAFGTKVEVKNLNSFKSVEKAIAYELERQSKLIDGGGVVVQETRGWDEIKQVTFSQRLKETSEDYRYFPDPDLPKLIISEIPEFSEEALRKEMPELPDAKRARFAKEFGLKSADIENFVQDETLGNFFESVIGAGKFGSDAAQLAANYITSDLAGILKAKGVTLSELKVTAESFAKVVAMIGEGKLSSRGAKDLLGVLADEGGDPATIAEGRGLLQQNDEGALLAIVEKVLDANKGVVDEYKAGKESSLQFLVGQVMKETKGSANPGVLQKLLKEALSK